MSDLNFYYCMNCGAMNFLPNIPCQHCVNMMPAPEMRRVDIYFDEADHVEYAAPKHPGLHP